MSKCCTYRLYNYWDFNFAGYIFEKETKHNIYDEVKRALAVPLGMQDWQRSNQRKDGDISRSNFYSYPMTFSTREIGLLMLNRGKWGTKQIIDSQWLSEVLTPRTNYEEVNKNIPVHLNSGYSFGYGYMWWLWQNVNDKRLTDGYSAMGAWGQSISVFPAVDVVIVYKTKDLWAGNGFYGSIQGTKSSGRCH